MHVFHKYLSEKLEAALGKRRIAVWYDPRGEFRPFIKELCGNKDIKDCEIIPINIDELSARLCVFDGSYFQVKFAVEPLVSVDEPEPLLVYIPEAVRDRKNSVLMELEQGGECFEWKLKSHARYALRQQYTDGVIDEMLLSDTVAYEDIVGLLEGEGDGKQSMLKVIFARGHDNLEIIAAWLAESKYDKAVEDKGACGELFKLVESRLGLQVPEETKLEDAREQTVRYVLIGEFRYDLKAEAPDCIHMVPGLKNAKKAKSVTEVANILRAKYGEAYVSLADKVEQDFQLANQDISPTLLGIIDTFRFEEKALLKYAGGLICKRRFEDASHLVIEHIRSFWSDRDIKRHHQWEACRLMSELGIMMKQVRDELPAANTPVNTWIKGYTAKNGWYRVDSAHRNLESLVANMLEEPDSEKALQLLRNDYEELAHKMTVDFVESLKQAEWSVSGIMNQTEIFSDVVRSKSGQVAYFLVDSLRYEMGVELERQLSEADDLMIVPAIAAIPTITTVGMAALLPGASSSFNVQDKKGKLSPSIEATALPDIRSRLKFFKSRVPSLIDFELDKLLQITKKQLASKLKDANLILVRSQDIDAAGESGGSLLARQMIDIAIGNISRAIKKLANQGVEQFVICADHGHLFSWDRDESMRIDNPGGDTIEYHRRCWIGRGGGNPNGTIRIKGTELGYDTDLDFMFPLGMGVFKTGGDLAYHHGGLSLQELVIPVLSARIRSEIAGPSLDYKMVLSGVPDLLTNRTFGISLTIPKGLFGNEPVIVRPVLLSKGVQVGEVGMAIDADLDTQTRCVTLLPGDKAASIAMLLKQENCDKIKVVVQDPNTDRVLVQSSDIPVRLEI